MSFPALRDPAYAYIIIERDVFFFFFDNPLPILKRQNCVDTENPECDSRHDDHSVNCQTDCGLHFIVSEDSPRSIQAVPQSNGDESKIEHFPERMVHSFQYRRIGMSANGIRVHNKIMSDHHDDQENSSDPLEHPTGCAASS